MVQWLLRAIIGIVCFLVFFYALPLVLSLLSLHMPGALFDLVHLLGIVVVCVYIVWGAKVPVPGAS